MPPIRPSAYFDWAATAPLCDAARLAMVECLSGPAGNPSSLHGAGKAARLAVQGAREDVAALIGARPSEIVFTSGATEADNLAVRGAAWAAREDRGARHVLVSAVEHPAVLRAADALRDEGFTVELIPVARDGVVDPHDVQTRLRTETALVSLMAVNNEVGTIQPVARVAELAHAVGAHFHCDAVQAIGCMAVDVREWGVDMLSLSAHKIGGPQGAGALFVRSGLALRPLLVGGEQENQRRAGTENVAALVGFGAAAREVALDRPCRVAALREVERAICEMVDGINARSEGHGRPSGARRVGRGHAPHIACFQFDGVDAETLLYALDMEGVAASSGSACSSRTMEPSPVLIAMGFGRDEAMSTIRLSWGPGTDAASLGLLRDILPRIVARNRQVREVAR